MFPIDRSTDASRFPSRIFAALPKLVQPIAGTIFRETMNQPGVYWFLEAPYVQIVGMYSNAAENPGFISAQILAKPRRVGL